MNSMLTVRIFLIAGALIVGTIAGCKENPKPIQRVEADEESIPKGHCDMQGKWPLELQETFELGFDKDMPGIGFVAWMGISPEGTLMVADRVSRQAHEINYRDNKHIRSFGRTGRGPGEHWSAENMSIDPEGRVYLLDGRGSEGSSGMIARADFWIGPNLSAYRRFMPVAMMGYIFYA